MHYRVRYLLDFDLKLRSGQGCIRSSYVSSNVGIAQFFAGWRDVYVLDVIVDGLPLMRVAGSAWYVCRCAMV